MRLTDTKNSSDHIDQFEFLFRVSISAYLYMSNTAPFQCLLWILLWSYSYKKQSFILKRIPIARLIVLIQRSLATHAHICGEIGMACCRQFLYMCFTLAIVYKHMIRGVCVWLDVGYSCMGTQYKRGLLQLYLLLYSGTRNDTAFCNLELAILYHTFLIVHGLRYARWWIDITIQIPSFEHGLSKHALQ